MRQQARVTFAMRDLDRLKCIQEVVEGDLKPIKAADRLGLTTRQVRRLARRYAAQGPAGMISRRFNRRSNNRLHDDLADRVLKLLRSKYPDFGPTLAAEKLRTKHAILVEDRAPPCTALVYIDDATSRLMEILFAGTESTFGYFEATHASVRLSLFDRTFTGEPEIGQLARSGHRLPGWKDQNPLRGSRFGV
jgi:hypothetical protein